MPEITPPEPIMPSGWIYGNAQSDSLWDEAPNEALIYGIINFLDLMYGPMTNNRKHKGL